MISWKMRRVYVWVAVISLLLMLGCCACSKEESDGSATVAGGGESLNPFESMAVAIIVDEHANSKRIVPNAKSLEEILMDCAEMDGEVTIISAEGNPRILYDSNARGDDEISEKWSKRKKEKHYNYAVKRLMEYFETAVAESDGLDTLRAINMAANELYESAAENKYLIIADTGLSTVAPMDFNAGILYAEPESIVANLEDAKALPDLNGVQVIWYGLGAVAAPQESLSYQDLDKLEAIYGAIFEASGAASVDFSKDSYTEDLQGVFPDVPIVNVDEENQDTYDPPWDDDGYQIGEEELYFIPDTDKFKSEADAEKVLGPIAEVLAEHPEEKILLIGCTATADKNWCQELSEMRADACRKLLVRLGASENQIVTKGLGYWDPWHISDLDASGRQTKDAQKNRKIVILDYSGAKAQSILKEYR